VSSGGRNGRRRNTTPTISTTTPRSERRSFEHALGTDPIYSRLRFLPSPAIAGRRWHENAG
jgi:hypothetical protein